MLVGHADVLCGGQLNDGIDRLADGFECGWFDLVFVGPHFIRVIDILHRRGGAENKDRNIRKSFVRPDPGDHFPAMYFRQVEIHYYYIGKKI